MVTSTTGYWVGMPYNSVKSDVSGSKIMPSKNLARSMGQVDHCLPLASLWFLAWHVHLL
jgi:hypothetical protein